MNSYSRKYKIIAFYKTLPIVIVLGENMCSHNNKK